MTDERREYRVFTKSGPMRISATDRDQAKLYATMDGYELVSDEEIIASLEADLAAARQQLVAEEASHMVTIGQRDRASEAADELAYTLGTVEEIGEHSNLNCPWKNATELAVSLKRDLAAARQEAEVLRVACDASRNLVASMERELSEARGQLLQFTEDVRTLTDEGDAYKAELSEARQELDTLRQECERLQRRYDECTKESARMSKDIDDKDELRARAEEAEKECEEACRARNGAIERAEKAEAERDDLIASVRLYRDQMATHREAAIASRKRAEKAEAERNRLQAELDQRIAYGEAGWSLNEAREERDTALQKLSEAQETLDMERSAHKQTRETLVEFMRSTSEAQSIATEWRERAEKLEKECKRLRQDLQCSEIHAQAALLREEKLGQECERLRAEAKIEACTVDVGSESGPAEPRGTCHGQEAAKATQAPLPAKTLSDAIAAARGSKEPPTQRVAFAAPKEETVSELTHGIFDTREPDDRDPSWLTDERIRQIKQGDDATRGELLAALGELRVLRRRVAPLALLDPDEKILREQQQTKDAPA